MYYYYYYYQVRNVLKCLLRRVISLFCVPGLLTCVCLVFVFQYMTAAAAAAPMQGTYIPQYTPVPPTAVPVEVRPTHTHTHTHTLTITNVSGFTQKGEHHYAGQPTSARLDITDAARHVNRTAVK